MNNAQIIVLIIGAVYCIGIGYALSVWNKSNFITAFIIWLLFPIVFVINIGSIFYKLSMWDSE